MEGKTGGKRKGWRQKRKNSCKCTSYKAFRVTAWGMESSEKEYCPHSCKPMQVKGLFKEDSCFCPFRHGDYWNNIKCRRTLDVPFPSQNAEQQWPQIVLIKNKQAIIEIHNCLYWFALQQYESRMISSRTGNGLKNWLITLERVKGCPAMKYL